MSRNQPNPKAPVDNEGNDVEMTLEEEVIRKNGAKTKGIRPELMTGAAAMYDLSSYDEKYTAGGQLVGRFVNNDESRIAILKNKGYDVPSAWSSQLKDLRVGSQILMLRPKKLHEEYLNHRRSLAAQVSANDAPQNSPAYANFAQYAAPQHIENSSESLQLPGDVLVAD